MANSSHRISQEKVDAIIANASAVFVLPEDLLDDLRKFLVEWEPHTHKPVNYKEPDWWHVPQTISGLAKLLNCSRGTIYNRLEDLGEDVASLKDASGRIPPEIVRILATMRRDKRASHHYAFKHPDINLKT